MATVKMTRTLKKMEKGQLQRLEREATLAAFKDIESSIQTWIGESWKTLWEEMKDWTIQETHHGHCVSEEEAKAEFKENHGLNLSDVNWDLLRWMIANKVSEEDESDEQKKHDEAWASGGWDTDEDDEDSDDPSV
jgi:hypothetical protein